MFTNRELASRSGFTLGQIKTWAVLVCGRDPQADQGGGVVRNYDADSAFKIFLCGSLIKELGIGLKQAANYLNLLWPHLDQFKLLPKYHLKKRSYLNECFGIDLFILPKPKIHFQIRWRTKEEYQSSKIKETYSQEWIPKTSNPLGPYWQYSKNLIIYRIEFDYYLTTFLNIFS
jgi:hypothetical protein